MSQCWESSCIRENHQSSNVLVSHFIFWRITISKRWNSIRAVLTKVWLVWMRWCLSSWLNPPWGSAVPAIHGRSLCARCTLASRGPVCVETWKDLLFANPITIVNMYSRETSLSFVTNWSPMSSHYLSLLSCSTKSQESKTRWSFWFSLGHRGILLSGSNLCGTRAREGHWASFSGAMGEGRRVEWVTLGFWHNISLFSQYVEI